MSDFAAFTTFFLLIAVALFFAVLIGRNLFKTGVEYFSGRMLILFGIFNVFLCTLVLFSQTISHSSLSMSGRLFTGLLTVLIPTRILWNYWNLPKTIISRFKLQSERNESVSAAVVSIAKSMEITPPVIFSSESIGAPFVFGRRSARPYLAVPRQWNMSNNSDSNPVLLHEMAHIRNHDIGFLAWAQSYTKDFKVWLVCFPPLILTAYLSGLPRIASSLCLYLSCLFALYGLLKYVLRKREHLADKTAALLIESAYVEQTISEYSVIDFSGHIRADQKSKTGFGDSMYRWMADKAMFSKHPKWWAVGLGVVAFFRQSHPERHKRIKSIPSTDEDTAQHPAATGDAFWFGITLGFWGVAIGLCGYWLPGPMRYTAEEVECLHLSYLLYWILSPPTMIFYGVFVALRYWASLSNPNMNKTFFRALLKQHGIAFVGALVVSLLIATAGPFQLHFQVLTVLCALWQFFVMLMGFCFSIVSAFIWTVARYFQASAISNLKRTFWTLIPLLTVGIGATVLGMFQMSNGSVFEGANLIFSTLIGCVVFREVVGQSRFSDPDHYMALSLKWILFQIEGQRFREWNKIIDLAVIPLCLLFPILLLYGGIRWLFQGLSDDLNIHWTVLFLMIVGCIVLVCIQLFERGKARIARRPKIFKLFHSLNLLSKSQSTENLCKITLVANSYGLKTAISFNRPLNLTNEDIHELYYFSKATSPELCEQTIEWALRCQQPSGGFGLWPGSSPRLISTYQALSILKDSNHLDAVHFPEHIAWIKSLQQPDGSFKGSWSKRDAWEDAYLAVQSLNILHTSLDLDNKRRCTQWTCSILQDGINKDSSNKIYHSIGTLDALGLLDEHTSEITSNWLSGKVEKLLLANIGLNYENIHFVVMTYVILSRKSPLVTMTPHIKLLTDRIQTAFDAELADIRQLRKNWNKISKRV